MHYSISSRLSRTLDVARSGDLPVLLVGKHGIGKSEFLEDYAHKKDLKLTILDLSLLEPTDLTGIPVIHQHKTHYAPPVLLPDGASNDAHMIVLEELNRCDLSLRQPCLQLLTARQLNNYRLPRNSFLVACMNPSSDGYDVDELDPALLSRFLHLSIRADVPSWITWAEQNHVHSAVIAFVEGFPNAFETIPPRTWVYLSTLLIGMQEQGWSLKEGRPVMESMIGEIPCTIFYEFMKSQCWNKQSIGAKDILRAPLSYIDYIETLVRDHRMDVLSFLVTDIQHELENHNMTTMQREHLKQLLNRFPSDLSARIHLSLPA